MWGEYTCKSSNVLKTIVMGCSGEIFKFGMQT